MILAELHGFRRFGVGTRLDGISRPGAGRGLERRKASAWPHHSCRKMRWSDGCLFKRRGTINIAPSVGVALTRRRKGHSPRA